MSRIDDYKILFAYDTTNLQKEVEEFIRAGWQPHGSLCMTLTDEDVGSVLFCQPITFCQKDNE